MKIDIFNHIFPQRFFARLQEATHRVHDMPRRVRSLPLLVDLEARFRVMDEFGDYCQILSLASPPLEVLAEPDEAPELARLANDGLADLVDRYPARFPGFVASLPLNHPEAAVAEMHRAVQELGARGVQLFTNVLGRPLDEPDFDPIFEGMAAYDLPIWLHPARGAHFPDYLYENKFKFEIWWAFGWPYETSVAMAHLVFSGLFDRYPGLKIITHHMGGMVPYFEGRAGHGWDQLGKRTSDEDYSLILHSLKKRPLDYFKQFYADTALFGSRSGTRCGLDFFGADHAIFASDAPFCPEPGVYIRETIRVIEELDLTAADREKIYQGNAERLLKLSPAPGAFGLGESQQVKAVMTR
jgi:predicted TIM-barrel fold metal-dependent hydrolase